MTVRTLSFSTRNFPAWLIQAILGLIFTGFISWATWSTATTHRTEARVSVAESRVDDIKDDISEIKEMQKETIQRLDRMNDRRK